MPTYIPSEENPEVIIYDDAGPSYEFDKPLKNPLVGPFRYEISGTNGFVIKNGDRETIVWTVGPDVAYFVTRLLNLAYRADRLPKE